jgi:hypothetical protein
MSPTHPFRISRRSPHDDNGPNSAALRRSLASLQTHDRSTPSARVSAEPRRQLVERPSVVIPKQTRQEYASQETLTTEPAPESQPKATQTAQAEIPQPEETEAPEAEDRDTEKRETEAPETEDLDEDDETEAPEKDDEMEAPENVLEAELSDREEARIEAAELRAAQSTPRSDLLDARRFPKHYPAGPADPSRHERLCSICRHPDRDAIEEAFLQWQRACDIFREFKLPSRTTVYRHAHAVGLFEQRARALRFVLENIMEESSACAPSADSIIRAVRAYSCLDDRGRWIEPPRRLIIQREPFPAPPLPPGREITVEPSGTTER